MNLELRSLIHQSRIDKAALRELERQRVALHFEPECAGRDHAIEEVDKRINDLDCRRRRILHSIAKLIPGHKSALCEAVNKGYDSSCESVRYNRRTESFTFGMPDGSVLEIRAHE